MQSGMFNELMLEYGRLTAHSELWENGMPAKKSSVPPLPGLPSNGGSSVRPPPRPLYFEGTQSVHSSWSSGALSEENFINFRGTLLKCHHCYRQVSSGYLQGTLILSFATKSISRAEFTLNMDYQSQYTMSFQTQGQ